MDHTCRNVVGADGISFNKIKIRLEKYSGNIERRFLLLVDDNNDIITMKFDILFYQSVA